MAWVRRPEFAGSWYPKRESELKEEIQQMLKKGFQCPSDMAGPIGGIVPHAGWFYSGRLALSVIRCLVQGTRPDTILIFGHHLSERYPNIIMPKGVWSTPLGDLKVDQELGERLVSLYPFEVESEKGYYKDNTIELQLPFIRYFFGDVMIVPLGLPPRAESLAIVDSVLSIASELKRELRVLGSTDLTHYGQNYGFLPAGTGDRALKWVKDENDRRIVELFLKMDAMEIIKEAKERHNACCPGAAASAAHAAARLGAKKASSIGYYTSYDVLANESFVGYVGVIYYR